MQLMDESLRMSLSLMGIQHQLMLQFIKLELSMEQSKFRHTIAYRIFCFRRDFRLLKLDPTTKQIIPNPIEWVEMEGKTEIVRLTLLINRFIFILFSVIYKSINNIQLCDTDASIF